MYSFDIFDTLITRTTATPKGIFALMQEELQRNSEYCNVSEYIKDNFYYLRIHAEELANANFLNKDIEDITLEQIYEAMTINGDISPVDKQAFIDLECKKEYDNCIGIQENINKIKELLSRGEKVILISDMYLDYSTIQSILMKEDPIFSNTPIYVSSEIKQCKWNGKLFQYIREKENSEYQDWFHYGDNVNSDIKMAEALGIHAEQYLFEPLTLYEKKLISKKEDNALVQLTIGAARNTRLFVKPMIPMKIGCSLGGVILVPYVRWLLKQSINQGIQRLYFIARDGYVLKEIADFIIKTENYSIATYYIYGSRRAWRMASISDRNNDIDRIITSSYITNVTTIGELADLLELSIEKLKEFFTSLKFVNENQVIRPVLWYYIMKEIRDKKENFLSFLITVNENKRRLVAAYLQQEIDFSRGDFAFVEMAGSGLTQGCLANIIYDFYKEPLKTFFFKLDKITPQAHCIFKVFLPSMIYQHLVVEMLTRAPHGQTVGYEIVEEKVIPVICDLETKALHEHGIDDYIEGIRTYTKYYHNSIKVNSIDINRIDIIHDYINYLTKTPDDEMLEYIGNMPNSITGREEKVIEFAPRLNKKQARSIYLTRTDERIELYYQASALDYSIMRSSKKIKNRIHYYQDHYNKLYGRIARYPKQWKKVHQNKSFADVFPYGVLKGRVVLYAAGKIGQALYKEMKHYKEFKVVQWVDVKYEKYSEQGFPVVSPQELGKISFDQIIIAILDEQKADLVKETLMKQGIPRDKIVWMNLWAK